MTTPSYMKEKLPILKDLVDRLRGEDLEMTLVHRLMDKNGWCFPVTNDDYGDYDAAVEQVKWFVQQLLELAG